jgi:RHS repeat-associated protein
MLGAGNKQLAVYNGLQTSHCGEFEEVFFYPSEYITYGSEGYSNIVTKPDGTKEYYVFDQLGSVIGKFNQAGDMVARYEYEPFGNVFGLDDTPRNSFIDKEKDKESKLSDFGVRKYDVLLGRFTSIDPLWEKYYGLTPYNYCGNNPLIAVDPSGLEYYVNKYGIVQDRCPDYPESDEVFLVDGNNKESLGFIGGTIKADKILNNLINFHKGTARKMDMYNFGMAVKTGGRWDLKNRKNMIFGLTWQINNKTDGDIQTWFTFEGYDMEANDVGNFFYGVMGKYAGIENETLYMGAGAAEIYKKATEYGLNIFNPFSSSSWDWWARAGELTIGLPPYGDMNRDRKWINAGILWWIGW